MPSRVAVLFDTLARCIKAWKVFVQSANASCLRERKLLIWAIYEVMSEALSTAHVAFLIAAINMI